MKSTIASLLILLFFVSVQAQPVLVKEIPMNSINFLPGPNGKAFFFSGDSLWVSDGTVNGTKFVKELDIAFPIAGSQYSTQGYTHLGNYFIFIGKLKSSTGFGMWRSDGTTANTVLVSLPAGLQPGFILNKTSTEVYFSGTHPSFGVELWKLNSSFTASLIKDIFPGTGSSVPHDMIPFNGKFYFVANGSASPDASIWLTDGTNAGTQLAASLNIGSIDNLTDVNGTIFFARNFDNKAELWKTGGTTASTVLVKRYAANENPSDEDAVEFIREMFSLNGKLYFHYYRNLGVAVDLLNVSDGTEAGTVIIEQMNIDGFINFLTKALNKLVYQGNDQGFPGAVTVYDPATSSSNRIKDFESGDISEYAQAGNLFFFSDHIDASHGDPVFSENTYQLWQSDLTAGNTIPVKSLFKGTNFPGTDNIIPAGNKIFFTTQLDGPFAPIAMRKKRLWFYDPTLPVTPVPYFTVVNTDTDEEIQVLEMGDEVEIPTGVHISIRYHEISKPGSVVFKLADTLRRVESVAPYLLAGDNNGDYSPWLEVTEGLHKVTAIPYSQSGGKGTPGNPLMVEFSVKFQNANPIADLGPDRVIQLPKDTVIITAKVTDPDSDSFLYFWNYQGGSTVSEPPVLVENGKQLYVSNLKEGFYDFRVFVSDQEGGANSDIIRITVTNSPPPPSNPQFVLVNAATDTDIRDMLSQDTIIYNASTDKITIRAIPSKAVGSVVFHLDGAHYRTETSAPYALKGDFSGDYTAWPATYGNHTLTATAYTGSGGSGSVVETRTINFLVKQSGTTPPPPPPPSAQITLTLVNAATDANIRDMLNQDTIIYNSGTDKITIKAIPSKAVGSIVFNLDGVHYRTESVEPYALNGDNNGDYTAWPATFGNHTLTATAYTGSGGSGSVVETRTINFLVKESGVTPPPPPPSSEQITFTLVNAVTDQDIGPLVNGQTINLANLPTNKLNIRANSTMAGTKSVVFDFDGKIKFRTESAAPYALQGDNNGNYNEWIPPTGTHTLKATPFTSTGGSGTAGVALSITFNVTNSSTMAASVNMYPNPANERVSISLPDDPSENVLVIIYDEAGNKYYEATSQMASGSNDIGIDLTHLNMIPGIYFVKIISEDNSEKVVKLIKN